MNKVYSPAVVKQYPDLASFAADKGLGGVDRGEIARTMTEPQKRGLRSNRQEVNSQRDPSRPNTITDAHKEDIESAIERWRLAWQSSQVTPYLEAYSEKFSPDTGQTFSQWRENRRRVVGEKEARTIEITDLRMVLNDDANASIVEFKQKYSANSHRDFVFKRMYLTKVNGKWNIVRETSKVMTESQKRALTSNRQEVNARRGSNRVNISRDIHKADIESAIERWRLAWQSSQVTPYLEAYSDNFSPDTEQTFSQWRENRRRIVGKRETRTIEITDLRLVLNDDANASSVEFKQKYSANSHSDFVLKTLYLTKVKGKWKIAREFAFDITN